LVFPSRHATNRAQKTSELTLRTVRKTPMTQSIPAKVAGVMPPAGSAVVRITIAIYISAC